MTVKEQLHNSRAHEKSGFDPNCPCCVSIGPIQVLQKLVLHLRVCEKWNRRDDATAVANEQARMIAILKLVIRHSR